MDKAERMQTYLKRANAVMAKADMISKKVPSKAQPSMSESLYVEGINIDSSYSRNDYIPENNFSGFNASTNTLTESANKLPKSILNSILDNPIQNVNSGVSVIDNIMIDRGEKDLYDGKRIPTTEEMFRAKKNSLNENAQIRDNQPVYSPYQPTYQNTNQTPFVDYSLISSIFKSLLTEEYQKIKKTILAENKKEAIEGEAVIKLGDGKIKIITPNGNIYESKLKLVGNINDYKK